MKIELTPAGKVVLLLLGVLAAVGIVVLQGPDLRRYMKSEMM